MTNRSHGKPSTAGDRAHRQPWRSALVAAADGGLWLRLGVSHHRYVSERSFRRGFLRDVRVLMQRMPGVSLDLFIQCRAGGDCCRLEDLDATAARMSEAIQDYTGRAACASIDHDDYTTVRAAGGEIVLPGGGLAP